jgi:uncharacterized membrane protein
VVQAGASDMARVAWVGGAIGLATLVALTIPVGSPVRVIVLLLFACLGPGCALVTHLGITDRVAAYALAVTISLSVFVGSAAMMAWTGWWHTRGTQLILAAATLISCAVGMTRTRMPRWAG